MELVDTFSVHVNDAAADIVDAPSTTVDGFGPVEDTGVTGHPRAAGSPSKLRIESTHCTFMLVSSYGVESGKITGVGHFAFDEGSAHVNRAQSTRPLYHTENRERDGRGYQCTATSTT